MRFAMMCGATLSSTWIRFLIRPLVVAHGNHAIILHSLCRLWFSVAMHFTFLGPAAT